MRQSPLLELQKYGQSAWLDDIGRGMIRSGELQQLIAMDGLRGVTTNPKIFATAVANSRDYDEAIQQQTFAQTSLERIYESLLLDDVRAAATLFRPLYEATGGRHGFVSIEVNPHLAHDTNATVQEARRWWRRLECPNVLIKVPGTRAGLPAIRTLIRDGINVNVTLLFSLPRYQQVVDAYLAGLEDRATAGQPIAHLNSVASFFLSRIDALVDPLLEKLAREQRPISALAGVLRGGIAIASAKQAYQLGQTLFASERFRPLAAKGARPQRLLWASTGTKNSDYSDVKYVEALIGPDTVNTMPRKTLEAYREHGQPAPRLIANPEAAAAALENLRQVGLDLDPLTKRLENEGVEKFVRAFDELMVLLLEKCDQLIPTG